MADFMSIPKTDKLLRRIQEEEGKIQQLAQSPPPPINWGKYENLGEQPPINWGKYQNLGTSQPINWGKYANLGVSTAPKTPWYEKPQEYYSRPAAANIMLPIWSQLYPEDPGSQLYQEFLSEVENPLQYFQGFLPQGKARQAYNIAQMPRGSRAAVEIATELPIWMALPPAAGLRAGGLAARAAGVAKGASAAEIAAGLATKAVTKGAKAARVARAVLKPIELMEKAPVKLLQKLTKRRPITSTKILGRIWDKSPAEDREALAKLAGLEIPKVGMPKVTPGVTRIGSRAWNTLAKEEQKAIASIFKQPLELVALSADDPTIQPLIRKTIRFMEARRVARTQTELLTTAEKGVRVAKALRAKNKVLKAGGTMDDAMKAFSKQMKEAYPYEKFIAPEGIPTSADIDKLRKLIPNLTQDVWENWTADTALKELFDATVTRGTRNFELDLLRRLFGSDFVNAIKPLSRNKRMWNRFLEIANFPRAVLASYDISATLRQNLFELLAHPKQFPNVIRNQIGAIISGETAAKNRARYMAREGIKEIDDILRAGGIRQGHNEYVPALMGTPEATFYQRSEEFMSRFAERAWGIKHSGRAFIDAQTNMYTHSMSEFWKLYKNVATTTDILEFAKLAGTSIGRGGLGSLKFASPILNASLFAPRYTISLFRLPTFLFSPSPLVRREAMKRMVRFLMFGVYTLRLAQMSGAGVEVNPLSPDLGKIRLGKTRIDFWRGYSQLTRFMNQLAVARRKSTSGRMYETTRKEIIERFFLSKSSPGFGLLYDLLAGKTYMGETIEMDTKTLKRQAFVRLTPLVIQDFVDALEEENLAMATGAGVAATLGLGVQTYRTLGRPSGGFGQTGFGQTGFGQTGFGK